MRIEQPLSRPSQLFIDGEWVNPSTDAKFEVMDSTSDTLYYAVAAATENDVNRAVAAARGAFDNGPWPRMSHAERARYMYAIADELDKRAEQRAQIWTVEAGVLYAASKARMQHLSNEFRAVADLSKTFEFEEKHPSRSGGEIALLIREPVGVVAAIAAWNGPSSSVVSKVAPALLTGCTVIFKAAPEAPGAAYILAEACESAGLPPGVVNILTADRDASERLVRHPGVDKVSFTGSTSVGLRIATICSERLARYSLELGGKSPAIVLDDYDVGIAAQRIAEKAIFLTGQVCISLTRVIVPRQKHDDLVDALTEQFKKVQVGDPFDTTTQMGPLVSERHLRRVQSYVEKGKAEGALLATGGKRPAHLSCGYFIEPTVFANVRNDQVIAREEIFGPVLSVIPVDDERQAVDVANDTIYGLNASVFTNDVEKAYTIARRLRSGTVGQNGTRNEQSLAVGGFKQSGVGREGGVEGLRNYLETKVVVLDAIPQCASA
jgi:aldehyde dehydrogenase (NAD+)